MAVLSILEITDGTDIVDLVTPLAQPGAHLNEWNPGISQFKGGGVRQSSSLASLSRLVEAQFENGQETFNLKINGQGEDETIRHIQDLLRLLQQAIYYWVSEEGSPVYLKAKSPCETNTRYADIRGYSIPNVDNPYAAPFFVAGQLALMDEIELTIERGHWLANPPGTGECATIRNIQEWNNGLSLLNASPASGVASFDMVRAANGDLFMSRNTTANTILRSQNGGTTWGTVAIPAGAAVQYKLFRASNDYLFLGRDGQLERSTNDGANWSTVFTPTNEIWGLAEDTSTGTLWLGDEGGDVYNSTDDGANWNGPILSPNEFIWEIFVDSNFYIYVVATNKIYRSTDGGVTWRRVFTGTGLGQGGQMVENSRGLFVAFDAGVLMSDDDGVSWQLVLPASLTSRGGGPGYNLHFYQTSAGVMYVNYPTLGTFRSTDLGLTWELVFSPSTTYTARILYIDDLDNIYISEQSSTLSDDNLWSYTASLFGLGADAANCDEAQVYTSNKYTPAQLTHIKTFDGASFVDLMPMTAFPINLFPNPMATGHLLYFISDINRPNTGPFDNVVLYLSQIIGYGTGTASLTSFTWQYWNGAWVTLTVYDGTLAFTKEGVASVHWVPPADWATTTINGVTGWIVRVVAGSISTTITPPQQGERAVYTANSGHIEALAENVLGDIPALIRLMLTNTSDRDGRGGSAPNLWANRIIAGLRSFEGDSAFNAFINISDQLQPAGISVTLGTLTSFAADNTAPTGRRAVYNPGGVEAMATRATVTIGPLLARDYYGVFHAYVRARRTGGSATDLSVRIQVVTGSGGISFTSEVAQLQTTTAFELLDFKQIEIPVSGAIRSDELPDTIEIRIQASAASGTPDLYLYDLILIPVDEWAIDAYDPTNSDGSIIGGAVQEKRRQLDIDSVSYPILDIRTLVREVTVTDLIVAEYNPITGGEAIAQNNRDQRYWILAARTSATGSSYSWIAEPQIAHAVKAYKNERYLALRGDR